MTAITGDALVALGRLREPFPPEQVGLLPRVTCRDCSKNQCQNQGHRKAKCPECGAYTSPAHIHLDYVGHGAVTDRLLAVDPEWNWEPLRLDQDGMPAFVYDRNNQPIEFWIRLTVLGVTRLGVGTCPAGQFDASKVLIGDALRNAAMRFGVALDLWIKGHAEDDERSTATSERTGTARNRDPLAGAEKAAPKELVAKVTNAYDDLDANDRAEVDLFIQTEQLPEPSRLTVSQAQKVLDFILSDPSDDAVPSAATGEGSEPASSGSDLEPVGAATQLRTQAEEIAAAAPEVTT